MSFKAHQGVLIKGVSTIEELHAFVEDLRPTMVEEFNEKMARELLQSAANLYDLYTLLDIDHFDPDDDSRKPLLTATLRHWDFQRKMEEHQQTFEIGFKFIDGHLLALPFFPDQRFVSLLVEREDVELFGYWDNVDPDENCTKAEWALRKRLWTSAFPRNNGVPSEVMFISRLFHGALTQPTDEQMARNVPDRETRIKNVARHFAFTEANDEVGEDADLRVGRIFEIAAEKTPALREKYGSLPYHDITLKTLETPLPKKDT